MVLADSSIVVLALPEIYRSVESSVNGVVWVLIAFNLVLAALAVPAAHLARRLGPGRTTVAGLVLFAGSSLACAAAEDLGPLVAARCVQAAGGAAAVCAALELLPATVGSERRAAVIWAVAGATGAAIGPAGGGLLTELSSWQSIVLVQVPIALGAAVPLLPVAAAESSRERLRAELRPAGRPHLEANLALALVSAALTAALFLVVLLMIEGWRLTPIAAAAAVSVLPLAAIAGTRLAAWAPDAGARAAAGAILIAGGLAGLAFLPRASAAATLPAQALAGVGLALALSALTETALSGRSPQAIHGGWTIASRHAGVVACLLLLTPVVTADLDQERRAVEQAGTAVLLDADAPPGLKLDLAARLAERIDAEDGKVPVIGPAFEPPPEDASDRQAEERLRVDLQDQIDRAATHAFSASFLIAAAFAAAALLPIALARRRVSL